jgi:hypothetical protein
MPAMMEDETDVSVCAGFWRRQPTPIKIGFLLFILVSLLFVAFLPSFEGPDETEHYRYVLALADGAAVHPIDLAAPTRYGYEVFQPPFYYCVAALWARMAQAEPMERLTVNPSQNPQYPFIRHDLPGHVYPWTGGHLGLRKVRLLSLLAGVAVMLLTMRFVEVMVPTSVPCRVALLAIAFTPNMLQLFSTVGNDGLSAALAMAGLVVLLPAFTDRQSTSTRIFLVSGVLLGLAVLTKLTALIMVAAVGSLILIDAMRTGTSRRKALCAGIWILPILFIVGGYMAYRTVLYGDPTGEWVLTIVCPGMRKPEADGVLYLIGVLLRGLPGCLLADLFWTSITLTSGGKVLALLWFAGIAGWTVRCGARIRRGESWRALDWLPLLATIWALAFQVAANRHFASLQVRHMLVVWPLLATAPILLIANADPRHRARVRIAIGIAILLPLSGVVWSLFAFQRFYGPTVDGAADRSYDTYLYAYHRDRNRGTSYLENGSFVLYDVAANLRQGNWQEMIRLVEGTGPTLVTPEIRHLYAIALLESGDYPRAIAVCETLVVDLPAVAIVHVRALWQSGQKAAARELIGTHIATTEGPVQDALIALREEYQ